MVVAGGRVNLGAAPRSTSRRYLPPALPRRPALPSLAVTKAPKLPDTIEACDRELAGYRDALKLVSRASKDAVMDQIDRLLEERHRLAQAVEGDPVQPVVDSSTSGS